MKKHIFIVACVLGILCAFVLPSFAEDTQEVSYYQYVFTPVKDTLINDYSNFPASFTVANDVVSTLDNSIIWHTGDSVTMANYVQASNNGAKISFTVNGTSGTAYLAYGVPFYIFAEESSLTSIDVSITLSGTPVYAPVPAPFGGSVSDGVSSSVGFAGQVLDFIVDSPILICVGISVGVFLCGFAISKIKDLIKGY